MDPNQMPAALLRAGRVELWLETKLPDARARQEILDSNLICASSPFHGVCDEVKRIRLHSKRMIAA